VLERGENLHELFYHSNIAEDRQPIIDIFNYYVENSYSSYPENKLPHEAFDKMLQMANGLPEGQEFDTVWMQKRL
jgi:L-amino acid N-acyltransferase YncA